jgi:hypothetical protein
VVELARRPLKIDHTTLLERKQIPHRCLISLLSHEVWWSSLLDVL